MRREAYVQHYVPQVYFGPETPAYKRMSRAGQKIPTREGEVTCTRLETIGLLGVLHSAAPNSKPTLNGVVLQSHLSLADN